MFKSIKWRLAAIFFAVTAVFLFLLGLYLMHNMEVYSYNATRAKMQSNARVIAEELRLPVLQNPAPDFLQGYARQAAGDIEARVTVISREGRVLGDSVLDKDSMVNHASRPEVKQALNGEVGESHRFSTSLEERMYYLAVPVKSDRGVTGVVRVAIPWSEIEQGQNHIRLTVGAAILVALILMVIVATSFTSELVVPLERMSEVAQEMAEGRLDLTLDIQSDNEIGTLGRRLNYMAQRLKETIGQITEERNKVKAILTSMSDGVIAVDRNAEILMINPAVEKMFNVKADDSVGKSVIEVVRNYDLEKLLRAALDRPDSFTQEIQMFAPDLKSFRISTAPLTNESGVVGVVAVMRDITAFRQVERMKTDFVANVSHELRTPLTSVKGFVETLLDGALEEPATARHFLEIINDETDRLSRLINDLLSLSKIEAKKLEINWQPLNLAKIISSTVSILSPQAAEKNQTITLDIKGQLPTVEADEDMIGQVLINLIDNAVKYTPPDGQITVTAEADADEVRVAVCDTGIGIPQDSLNRLFERFYRVDKARSREMGGTGLGLAIVKHILEVHRGRIEVTSRLGHGSTFTFHLPIKAEKSEGPRT